MADTTLDSAVVTETDPSKVKRAVKTALWAGAFLFCLLFFTLLKLPEERIHAYVQGQVTAALAPQGIGFSAESGSLGLFFGPSYTFRNITLTMPSAQPVKIDSLQVSPSLLSLITGKMGGSADLANAGGGLKLRGTMAQKPGETNVDFGYDSQDLDLGKIGLLPMLAHVQGSAITSGTGQLTGNIDSPATLSGNLKFDLSKIVIDQQSIQGFAIPKLEIKTARIEISIDRGKAIIKALQVGKEGTSDDLIATITGDAILGKQLDASTLNLKAKFRLSEKILKAFVLADAILGAGKQPDGSYAFNLAGPISNLNPTPATP